jgi:hypothetical protein
VSVKTLVETHVDLVVINDSHCWMGPVILVAWHLQFSFLSVLLPYPVYFFGVYYPVLFENVVNSELSLINGYKKLC